MYYSTIIGCVCRRRTPRLHLPLLSSAYCFTPVVSGVGFSPHAAPCGHFALLVRSTFGLRGCPPNRRSAPHLRRITRPLCASHNSARFNGHSPFPHFHIPILPHYIRFGLWLWFWVVVWVMVWLWLSAFRVVVEGSAAKVSSPRSARWFSLRAKERERKNSPSPAALVRD